MTCTNCEEGVNSPNFTVTIDDRIVCDDCWTDFVRDNYP